MAKAKADRLPIHSHNEFAAVMQLAIAMLPEHGDNLTAAFAAAAARYVAAVKMAAATPAGFPSPSRPRATSTTAPRC